MSAQFTSEVALWFCNGAGNHNYLDNPKRPPLNLSVKTAQGTEYASIFENRKDVTITVLKSGKVRIEFDAKIKRPVFRTPMQRS